MIGNKVGRKEEKKKRRKEAKKKGRKVERKKCLFCRSDVEPSALGTLQFSTSVEPQPQKIVG